MKKQMEHKIAASNKKVFRDFQVLETYEAGIVLKGCEVKSLRDSRASLQDSFCKIANGEILLYNTHISQYEKSRVFVPNVKRPRKLLLHKKEIKRLFGKMTQGGLALIPLEIYFNHKGIAKVKIGLAKKLKGPDKREMIKRKEIEREMRNINRWDG